MAHCKCFMIGTIFIVNTIFSVNNHVKASFQFKNVLVSAYFAQFHQRSAWWFSLFGALFVHARSIVGVLRKHNVHRALAASPRSIMHHGTARHRKPMPFDFRSAGTLPNVLTYTHYYLLKFLEGFCVRLFICGNIFLLKCANSSQFVIGSMHITHHQRKTMGYFCARVSREKNI